jgi:hypothetical protein
MDAQCLSNRLGGGGWILLWRFHLPDNWDGESLSKGVTPPPLPFKYYPVHRTSSQVPPAYGGGAAGIVSIGGRGCGIGRVGTGRHSVSLLIQEPPFSCEAAIETLTLLTLHSWS